MKAARKKLKLVAFAAAMALSMGAMSVAQADSLDGPDWMPPKAPICLQNDGQSNVTYKLWLVDGWVQWHPQTGPTSISKMGTQCYFCDAECEKK